jgi:hypothetical protein
MTRHICSIHFVAHGPFRQGLKVPVSLVARLKASLKRPQILTTERNTHQ